MWLVLLRLQGRGLFLELWALSEVLMRPLVVHPVGEFSALRFFIPRGGGSGGRDRALMPRDELHLQLSNGCYSLLQPVPQERALESTLRPQTR